MIKELLKGYDSEENSYSQDDYPYGRKLRCIRRVWIETTKRGQRFCAQTQDPRNGRWNKPKKSTYSDKMFLYLDENDHVQTWSYSIEWGDLDSFHKFAEAGELDLESEEWANFYRQVKIVHEARKVIKVEIKPSETISLTALMNKDPEEQAKADRISEEQERIKENNERVTRAAYRHGVSVVDGAND